MEELLKALATEMQLQPMYEAVRGRTMWAKKSTTLDIESYVWQEPNTLQWYYWDDERCHPVESEFVAIVQLYYNSKKV